MGILTLNGVSINYRTVGEGEDVVAIHGIAANHAFWRIDVLLPLARDHRVTVYDLRGHGRSGMPSRGYTSADMAKDLHHLLTHLKISKAHLVGHSVGGVVALHYAVLHPERVASLIVADSRVRALQPTQCASDWPNWKTANKRLEELGLSIPEDEPDSGIWFLERLASPEWREARQGLEGTPLSIPFGGWNGGQATAERWLELLCNTTARKDLTSVAGLTQERLSEIKHPILAVFGARSAVLPSLRGLQALLPQCKTVIVPRAGHFYPLTRPRLFVNIVRRFLKEL
jgi:pimeloyl-ACP methyl ester carboxylesterase